MFVISSILFFIFSISFDFFVDISYDYLVWSCNTSNSDCNFFLICSYFFKDFEIYLIWMISWPYNNSFSLVYSFSFCYYYISVFIFSWFWKIYFWKGLSIIFKKFKVCYDCWNRLGKIFIYFFILLICFFPLISSALMKTC